MNVKELKDWLNQFDDETKVNVIIMKRSSGHYEDDWPSEDDFEGEYGQYELDAVDSDNKILLLGSTDT